jgi:hypothetical protein
MSLFGAQDFYEILIEQFRWKSLDEVVCTFTGLFSRIGELKAGSNRTWARRQLRSAHHGVHCVPEALVVSSAHHQQPITAPPYLQDISLFWCSRDNVFNKIVEPSPPRLPRFSPAPEKRNTLSRPWPCPQGGSGTRRRRTANIGCSRAGLSSWP